MGTGRLPAWLKRSTSSSTTNSDSDTSKPQEQPSSRDATTSDGMMLVDAGGGSCLAAPNTNTSDTVSGGVTSCEQSQPRLLLAGQYGWHMSPCGTAPIVGKVAGEEVRFGGLLGTGSTAQVFSGTWAGRDVVVKVLHHDSTCAVQDHAQHIRQLVSLDNANVVRTFCGVTFTSQEAYPGGGAKCGLQPLAAAAAQDVPTRGRDQHSATSTTSSSGQPPKPQQLASTAEGQPTSTQASASSAPAAAASPAAKPPSVLLSFGRQGKSGRRASDLSAFAQLLPAAGMQQSQQQHQSRQRRSSACVVPADAERGVVETWLVQEHCDLNTLSSVALEHQITGEGDLTMFERLSLLLDAARGLKYLHSCGITHGDLNANNVMVCRSPDSPVRMTAKLTDMGLPAAIKRQGGPQSVRLLSHVAPELQRQQGSAAAAAVGGGGGSTAVAAAAAAAAGASRPSDVYAFGILMWELYTAQAAYRKLLDPAHLYEVVVLQNLRPQIPTGMPADYQLLMERCWSSDPTDRPTVDKIIGCLSVMAAERHKRIDPHAGESASATPAAAAALAAAAARGPWARSCDAAAMRAMMASAQQQGQHTQGQSAAGGSMPAQRQLGMPQSCSLPPRRRPTPAPGALLPHSNSCPSRTLQTLLQSGSVLAESNSSHDSDYIDNEDEEEVDDNTLGGDTATATTTEAEEELAELQDEENMLSQLRANSMTQSGPGSARVLQLCQPHQRFADALAMPLPELSTDHMWHI